MDAFDLRLWPGFKDAGGCILSEKFIDEICIDSRRITSPNSVFVALQGSLDGHDFIENAVDRGARYIIAQKEKRLPTFDNTFILRVENTLKALQEIATAYRRQLPCHLVAITGSYGKTMVKDLLQTMLSTSVQCAASPESFNSQIGVALSLLKIKKHHQVALIEAAASQPGEMDNLAKMIQPNAVIVTHFGKKHLATFGSKEILAEELSILANHATGGWSLSPTTPYPLKAHSAVQQYAWDSYETDLPHAKRIDDEIDVPMPYQITFPDGFNYVNRIATGYSYALDLVNIASKAAWLLGISSHDIQYNLQKLRIQPMRTEIWRSPLGITFINDSYCSDPQSVISALKLFDREASNKVNARRIFVFGGFRNNNSFLDYQRIALAFTEASLDQLILVGDSAFDITFEKLSHSVASTPHERFQNYEEAFEYLSTYLKDSDLVIFKGAYQIKLDQIIEAFNDSSHNNLCLINLEAIKANIAMIRSKLPQESKIMVMVKAFAYGTDEVRIAKFLESCNVDLLGVAYCDEAITLRRAGIRKEIFVINAVPSEASKIVKWELTVGVSNRELILAIAETARSSNKRPCVHLHIDTGMSRFGCRPEEAKELALLIRDTGALTLEGIMTHFASADDPKEDSFTYKQAAIFDDVILSLKNEGLNPSLKHAANSSATLRFDLHQYNLVRIGLAAYGLYASDAASKHLELRRALTLVSKIVGINHLKEGESISYGRTYKVEEGPRRIAVLPIGYFDGLHRHYSGKGYVVIRGRQAPMVGCICMDYMMVDISNIPAASIGDSVLIFGHDDQGHVLEAEKFADHGSSNVHELITCLGPRIPRIFIHEDAKGD